MAIDGVNNNNIDLKIFQGSENITTESVDEKTAAITQTATAVIENQPEAKVEKRLSRSFSEARTASTRRLSQELGQTRVLLRKNSSREMTTEKNVEISEFDPHVWREQVNQALEVFARKKFSQGIIDPEEIVNLFIEKELLLPEQVHKKLAAVIPTSSAREPRYSLAAAIPTPSARKPLYSLESTLLSIKHVKKFLDSFKKLSEKNQKRYTLLIGKEVLKHLELCLEKQERSNLISDVKDLSKILESIEWLSTNKWHLSINFDKKIAVSEEEIYKPNSKILKDGNAIPVGKKKIYKPISKIFPKDVIDSFRFYWASDAMGDITTFYINQKGFAPPKMTDLETHPARVHYFMEWLIGHLNAAIGNPHSDLNVKEQADLICNFEIDLSIQNALTNQLAQLIERHSTSQEGITAILNGINAKPSEWPEGFYKWAEAHLSSYLQEGKKPDPYAAITQFGLDKAFVACKQHIPCYAILQALSFSAYGHANRLLEKELCPKLWHTNIDIPRIKHLGNFPTIYQIDTHKCLIQNDNPKRNYAYTVIHTKPHFFVTGRTSDIKKLGKFDAKWELHGTLDARFSGIFYIRKLELMGPMATRKEILSKLPERKQTHV